ncbi:MAG: NUDIX hydrolase [Phycisphaeraceae bacterium]
MPEALPYEIAVLCYLFDDAGRVLLLHRRKEPNLDLYSPVGGKLTREHGESPTSCALREIEEETGLTVAAHELHLTGIISEAGYGDEGHWLMFLYEVNRPVQVEAVEFREGRLEWHDPARLPELPIPQTDREVLWPLFWRYRGRFFMAHIDCHGGTLHWRLEQPADDATTAFSAGDANQDC